MKWSNQAQDALNKVPFFVRKKVKKSVEAHVRKRGGERVGIEDVNASKKAFLSGMAKEVKGYQVDLCFGDGQCSNTANPCGTLMKEAEAIVDSARLLDFLKENVQGGLKFHHEFRITAADCPNACSQPQIKDVGIIGAVLPRVTDEACTLCGSCVTACREKAVVLDGEGPAPAIDFDSCVMCGQCITACPTGTIDEDQKGYRVMLGGRLGRHPRLALEVPGLHTYSEVLSIVKNAVDFYKKNARGGKRFSQIFSKSACKIICPTSDPSS